MCLLEDRCDANPPKKFKKVSHTILEQKYYVYFYIASNYIILKDPEIKSQPKCEPDEIQIQENSRADGHQFDCQVRFYKSLLLKLTMDY